MNITNLEKEYARIITALNRTGILTLLPRSENLGVIGIDGKEHPVPIQEQEMVFHSLSGSEEMAG